MAELIVELTEEQKKLLSEKYGIKINRLIAKDVLSRSEMPLIGLGVEEYSKSISRGCMGCCNLSGCM